MIGDERFFFVTLYQINKFS